MKLYLYDEKHEQIISELPLSLERLDSRFYTTTEPEVWEELLKPIIKWLEENHIIDRYHTLVVADSYHQSWEDGESQISFENRRL